MFVEGGNALKRVGIAGLVIASVAAAGFLGASIGAASTHYQIRVNGAYLSPDVAPVVISGRMMVSARWIAEALGANVSYESSDSTAVLTSPNKSLGLAVTTATRTGSSITGTIVNEGSQAVQAVTVTATLWDSAGTVIGQPSVPLVPSTLIAGASASFSIPVTASHLSQAVAFEVAGGTAMANVGGTLSDTEWSNAMNGHTVAATMTLNSVNTPASVPNSLGGSDMPPTGDEFVDLNLTVQNYGSETFVFAPDLEIYVQDGTGHRYPVDDSTSWDISSNIASGGDLSPGQKLTGDVVFDVPTSASGLELVWDSGTENQVFWNLGLQ